MDGPNFPRGSAAAGTPSLEVRRHVETLRKVIENHESRGRRAIEVLEMKNTPAARQLLDRLAKGCPEANLTQEANASVRRLAGRARGGP
jgi:hypothetical protein